MPNWLLAHWRRVVMQAVLWLVLAGTIGVAALVTYEKRQSLRVQLAPARTFPGTHLRVSLPHGWAASVANNGAEAAAEGGGDTVLAEEPAARREEGRRLIIARQRSGGLVSPLEHLLSRPGLLSGVPGERELLSYAKRDKLQIDSIDVAGWPGKLVTQTLLTPTARGQEARKEMVACAVLPGAQALVIRLEGAGLPDAADRELMKQMAERGAVEITGLAPPADAGGRLELAGGVSVSAPGNFIILPGGDPNRTSRRILCEAADAWAVAELVPCLALGDEGDETMSALQTMLAARDPAWQPGRIRGIAPRTWQADPADARGEGKPPGRGDGRGDLRGALRLSPSRAYFLADPGGQALLAVFHGGPGDGAAAFDSAWAALAPTVRFSRRAEVALMLRNGTALADRLSAGGLGAWVERAGEQQWYVYDPAENVYRAEWMHLKWDCAGEGPAALWSGARTTWPHELLNPGLKAEQAWSGSEDLRRYTTAGARTGSHDPLAPFAGPAARAYQELTGLRFSVEGGVSRGNPPARQTSKTPADARAATLPAPGAALGLEPLPSQYVPGGWLPLLLGKISPDLTRGPALLRTESFVGCDGLPAPEPLALVVWHDDGGPVKLNEKGDPMDCVTTTLNGTGRLTRWYFAADGGLRYIDLADGLKAQFDSEKRPAAVGP